MKTHMWAKQADKVLLWTTHKYSHHVSSQAAILVRIWVIDINTKSTFFVDINEKNPTPRHPIQDPPSPYPHYFKMLQVEWLGKHKDMFAVIKMMFNGYLLKKV